MRRSRQSAFLAYQPILDMTSGTIAGFEGALARWTHPVFGEVLSDPLHPDRGRGRPHPVRSGTGPPQCSAWRPELASKMSISVNVSPEQLRDPAFWRRWFRRLRYAARRQAACRSKSRDGVHARAETVPFGCSTSWLALGRGLSRSTISAPARSRSAISRAPISVRSKIDRAFVAGAGAGQRESMAIVRAAIAMSERFGHRRHCRRRRIRIEYERCARSASTRSGLPSRPADAGAQSGQAGQPARLRGRLTSSQSLFHKRPERRKVPRWERSSAQSAPRGQALRRPSRSTMLAQGTAGRVGIFRARRQLVQPPPPVDAWRETGKIGGCLPPPG